MTQPNTGSIVTSTSDDTPGPECLGFVGLGQIGKPMAARWADWPGGLFVCDLDPLATSELERAGAKVASTPREVAEHATIVSVMVRDDEQVSAVLTGPDGLLRGAAPGSVVAIHSTIDARTAERLEAIAEGEGVLLVDAPVSGGMLGAVNGRLAIMVGGTNEAFQRCRRPFLQLGDLVIHAGPIGCGTRFKLARNLLHYASFAAAAEAQRLAEAAGLNLVDLGKVVRHSDAVTGGPGAVMQRSTTAPLTPDDPWYPILSHVRDLGEKDLALALDLAAELGVDLPLTRTAAERFAEELGLASRESRP
jgi:3-hydroxyisobutyrate dehydrogenase